MRPWRPLVLALRRVVLIVAATAASLLCAVLVLLLWTGSILLRSHTIVGSHAHHCSKM